MFLPSIVFEYLLFNNAKSYPLKLQSKDFGSVVFWISSESLALVKKLFTIKLFDV